MSVLHLSRNQYFEFENIALGALAPLDGFMTEEQFISVVRDMRLPGGEVFPLPVTLGMTPEQADSVRDASRIALVYGGVEVGELSPDSVFSCDKRAAARDVFGTDDPAHPGVAHFLDAGDVMVGGKVRLKQRVETEISRYELTPEEARAEFAARGWRTVVGFQTRNVPHRAHEHLQRLALERADGLFVQPLIGLRKAGDYAPQAIMISYRALIDDFYPADRVVLGALSATMRYAGPREAVFHALIRRNYGCSHFIVGRDHAGVGDYYGKYDAQELTRRFDGDLGIEILRFSGPFHCAVCDGIVTERSCPHEATRPDAVTQISATAVRAMLVGGQPADPRMMRPEIIASLKGVPLFIDESE